VTNARFLKGVKQSLKRAGKLRRVERILRNEPYSKRQWRPTTIILDDILDDWIKRKSSINHPILSTPVVHITPELPSPSVRDEGTLLDTPGSPRPSVMDKGTFLGEARRLPNDNDSNSDFEFVGGYSRARNNEERWGIIINGIDDYMENDDGIRVDEDGEYYKEVLFVAN
jgi:hypothetical protein